VIKPRVFVSSVVEGFGEFREAARRGIVAAGGTPILVNEDFPSLDASPRTACLDAVASADAYVVILGARGGWPTPAGKLVIEEEHEEAKRRKHPVAVFLQDTEREPEAGRFAAVLSDYVTGRFRRVFVTPAELQQQVEDTLQAMVSSHEQPVGDWSEFFDTLPKRIVGSNEAFLRVAVAPERAEELIDPRTFNSVTLWRQLNEIGHSSDVLLLGYSEGKVQSVDRAWMVLRQGGPHGAVSVEVRIEERGLLLADVSITGRRTPGAGWRGADAMHEAMIVDHADLEQALRSALKFYGGVLAVLDPYERYGRFSYNVAILNLGYRQIVRDPRPTGSQVVNMLGNEPVVAYQTPRVISRADLGAPEDEVARALARIVRGASQ
jgi:hypothetical protein